MRPVLLHYHILKNGGSSIIEILRRSYWGTFSEFDLEDRDAEIKPSVLIAFLERNPRVNAFSSHQIFYPLPQASGFLFFDICFLRDPIDRIRSIYDYFRGRPIEGDPIRQLASDHTLGDFVRRLVEEMPWTVNDVQVNLLANGLVHDQPRGIGDLEVATRRMFDTSFLGVVDRYNESLVAGQHGLSALFPGLNCVQAPVNDSAAPGLTFEQRQDQFRNSCDPGIYAELVRLNAMDLELLQRARDEVRRRFELVPDREERLRGLKQGVEILRARGDRIGDAPAVVPPMVETGRSALMKRWLRFATNWRASRPGSAFRRLFDAKFYLEQYPDVRAAGMNPLLHYVLHGAAEERKPNAWFQPEYYATICADARGAENPLMHFAENASRECFNPHPLFDGESYLRAHPETKGNALAAYLARRASRAPAIVTNPETFETAHFSLQDVDMSIAFPGDRFDSRAEAERRCIYDALQAHGEFAIVWRDSCGGKKFLCPAQQERFFECARYDQLASQVNGVISIP
jgi:hypothetical protein